MILFFFLSCLLTNASITSYFPNDIYLQISIIVLSQIVAYGTSYRTKEVEDGFNGLGGKAIDY